MKQHTLGEATTRWNMGGIRSLVCVLVAAVAPLQAAPTKPNILFVMVDEMKWNVMSCAGHPLVKTPNLDRLAQEGTRFAAAYTVAPICTPGSDLPKCLSENTATVFEIAPAPAAVCLESGTRMIG